MSNNLDIPKIALVSGASRGIGLAITKTLLANNWFVSAGSRSPIPELENYPANKYKWFKFDANDAESEKVWVTDTADYFGQIDALILNAGILSKSSVIQATSAEFDNIFETNVKSPMRITQCAWPYLKLSNNAKVVLMASLAGKRLRTASAGLYSMSKSAAIMLANGIRHSGAEHNIRCTAICPSYVNTDMANYLDDKTKKQLTNPHDIAQIVLSVLNLPFTASVAEIPINWDVESIY